MTDDTDGTGQSAAFQEKTDSVLRYLSRVKSKKPKTLEFLIDDIDTQDIVVLNLRRAVQTCIDIASYLIAYTDLTPASSMAESFKALKVAGIISLEVSERMIKATELRNLLVHE